LTSIEGRPKGARLILARDLSLEIVHHDLDPDFIRSFAVRLAWGYRALFDELSAQEGLTDEHRNELFNKRRGDVATQVLAATSKQHGVPFEFLRLECNGQRKPVARCGRLVLILEAVSFFDEHPQLANYKLSLSNMHSYMTQLEFNFGDRHQRVGNWEGTALGVLLHGATGSRFSQEAKGLGVLNLGLPDASYRQWISRIDLKKTAIFGEDQTEGTGATQKNTSESAQADNVVVRPKKKDQGRDVA
jgi:hypothetical protein